VAPHARISHHRRDHGQGLGDSCLINRWPQCGTLRLVVGQRAPEPPSWRHRPDQDAATRSPSMPHLRLLQLSTVTPAELERPHAIWFAPSPATHRPVLQVTPA